MTDDDTVTAKLAEWEALTEAATPGVWTFEPAGESECGETQCCYEYWDNRIWGDGAVLTESHMLSDEDARFIAAAPDLARALLGCVREVLAACEKAKANPAGDGSVKVHAAVIEQAAWKWIGGEGRG
jgi:hypothetical protein